MDESVIVLLIGAVAYQLGSAVLVPCSRGRRSGLGPSGHIPGKHRRYTADDLVRLRRMLSFARGRSSGGPAARPAVSRSALRMPIHDGDGSGALAVERANRAVRGPARSATRLDGRTLWSRVEATRGGAWRATDLGRTAWKLSPRSVVAWSHAPRTSQRSTRLDSLRSARIWCWPGRFGRPSAPHGTTGDRVCLEEAMQVVSDTAAVL